MHSNRSVQRNNNLAVRIAETAKSFVPGPQGGVMQTLDLQTAWQKLEPKYQEVIAVTVWDNLSASAAAQVLGISEANYRQRLRRARNALNKALTN